MELVDRYLHAVKFWLPRNQKEDIIAKLSEDLRSQIEEKESELGHQLTQADIEPILKRFGPPMAVAGRYLPQQFLIGPTLFPIYRVVIRALLLYFLLPWLLLWMGISIFSPDFRADHPGVALFASLEPWWLACTWSLFINTLIFAVLDRSKVRQHVVDSWNPRTLPPVRDANRISRASTIFELVVAVGALAFWIQLDTFHSVFHIFGITITLSSRWPYFFWALVALSVAGIALSCLNLLHARWTRLSARMRLLIDCFTWSLFYWLCRASLLQSLSGADLPSNLNAIVRSVNFWMAYSAFSVLVVGAVVLVIDVRRILRVGR